MAFVDDQEVIRNYQHNKTLRNTYIDMIPPTLTSNRVFPLINSPTMHPAAHTSTAFEYFVDEARSSGARYHLMDMMDVNNLGSLPISLKP